MTTPNPTQTSALPKLSKYGNPIGRPRAKKSDPLYRQVTVYIPVALHDKGRAEVERLMLSLRPDLRRDFSEIVEDALVSYLLEAERLYVEDEDATEKARIDEIEMEKYRDAGIACSIKCDEMIKKGIISLAEKRSLVALTTNVIAYRDRHRAIKADAKISKYEAARSLS